MTHKEFYDRTRPPCTLVEFTRACDRFFDAQFKDRGCQGVNMELQNWAPEDDTSPFFVLAKQVGQQLCKAFRYKPLDLKVMGSADGPDMLGSTIYDILGTS